jgi:hypothetical protein
MWPYVCMDAEDVLQHQHYDLSHVEAGRIVEVILEDAANVRIMNHASYQEYKAGRRHVFIGGFVTSSPFRASIPEGGHWHVVLDLGGHPGRIRSSVRVLPGTLSQTSPQTPPEQEPKKVSPLAAVPSLVLGRRGEYRPNDVFILHVPDDKAVVRSFAFALRKKGLRVAYDDFELTAGDNAHKKVNSGVGTSNFGVVVISRSLVKQGWVDASVAELTMRPFSGKQMLMPLWHDITRGEALEFCAEIANLMGRHTGVNTYDEIAEDIASLLQESLNIL